VYPQTDMRQKYPPRTRNPQTDGPLLHHDEMNPTHLRQVIAARIRALMAQRPDLDTQVKLARRAGLSQSTVARILSADSSATADSLAQLSHAFGTSAASLLLDDPAEINLLASMRGLTPESRQRLLGFVAGLSSEQHAQPPRTRRFVLDLSTPVPPSRRAAHAKAVARPITPQQDAGPTQHARKRSTR
jgi:transcriptional regulator with XRE-family HTH domain